MGHGHILYAFIPFINHITHHLENNLLLNLFLPFPVAVVVPPLNKFQLLLLLLSQLPVPAIASQLPLSSRLASLSSGRMGATCTGYAGMLADEDAGEEAVLVVGRSREEAEADVRMASASARARRRAIASYVFALAPICRLYCEREAKLLLRSSGAKPGA